MELESIVKPCVYKICCRDLSISDIYVGSTFDLKKRIANHKSTCNNPMSKGYNYHVYDFIRKNGGFDNWDIVLIKYCPGQDRHELEREERTYTEQLKATLNLNKVALTPKEREIYLKEYVKDFRERHPEYSKDYYIKHPDYNKTYYTANKERLNEKILCECGGSYARACKTQHTNTKKHKKLMDNKIIIEKDEDDEDDGTVKKLIEVLFN